VRTFNAAIDEARRIIGTDEDYRRCTVERHLDKTDGRSAWVEVVLRSKHARQSADLQVGTWRRKLADAGWTAHLDGSLWVEVDPDVAYVEHDERPVNHLAALLVEIDDALQVADGDVVAWMSRDLVARIRDVAAEYRR
jgi:hypothetical protein